jgi:GNAT superfamily N-acetyltransferase
MRKSIVRPARRSDLPRIAELLSMFTGEVLSAKEVGNRFDLVSSDRDQALLVASVDGEVAGLLGFRIRHNLESVSHYGEVSILVVGENWRRKGIGRILVGHAEVLARKRKCVGLWLVSGFGREAEAHQFYKRSGFRRTGVRFVKRF